MEKAGYMGIPGSFSEVAAEELLQQTGMTDVELVPLVSAQNIRAALEDGSIDYGILGIENSTAGPVSEFVQAFDGVSYEEIGRTKLPIHHCLFKKHGVDMSELNEAATHPQALRQTDHTRAAHWPHLKEKPIDDTAIGAEWLAKGELPQTTAVICSRKAGEIWDLDLIAENIEDSKENKTTFMLLKLV